MPNYYAYDQWWAMKTGLALTDVGMIVLTFLCDCVCTGDWVYV